MALPDNSGLHSGMLLMFRKLACIAVLLASTAYAEPVADLQKALSNARALSGEFTQTVVNRKGKTQTASGTFAILRPGKFRWNYKKPYEQLIVGDGKQVWLYDPDLQQVTVRDVSQALESSPAALLSGDNNLEKRYRLTALPARDGLDWVEATPRQNDSNFNKIRLGIAGGEIRRMELDDSFGQTTRVEFRNQVNKADAAQFSFTPPKGVDVVRQ